MRITTKRTVDRQVVGAAQKRLDDALAYSAKEMKTLAEKRKAVGAKPREGRVGGIHRDLVFEAVRKYGPEVLSTSGQDFWDAVKRENPVLAADGAVPGRDSINGHACHFGRIKEKFVGGKWYHWDAAANGWVEGEVLSRKGVR